ncbi:MAG: argininosuccinate lyase [Magnetococcus sp. WYHC-3]
MSKATGKLWGGRFSQPTDQFVERFTASIGFDARLYREDIRGSMVHCRMLARQGIIAEEEAQTILAGLAQVQAEFDSGAMVLQDALEDVHMHVEDRLRTLVGAVAGKLHTARSRNDQVATDIRLWLRGETDAVMELLRRLQGALLERAAGEVETIMPGFTHMQSAQPVTFAHHLLAYFEMLERDRERFVDLRRRLNRLPLGSAALAGTPFPVDREWVAGELGFEGVCENSLDAVSDRDFAVEWCAAGALVMVHLSRFSEELILWSSQAFGFIDLPDAFCTGSSIMPQKKNPDVPELVRGKSGRVTGNLMALITLMKALPLAYNRDMQEDKEPLMDTVDTVRDCLHVFAELVPGITVRHRRMLEASKSGHATATDLADYLVRKNVPFRQAHEIVGRLVAIAVEEQVGLEDLPLARLRSVDERIEADVAQVLTVRASVNARKARGGTAFTTVAAAIDAARARLLASATCGESGTR